MRGLSWEATAALLDFEEALLAEYRWDLYAASQHLSDEEVDNTLRGLDFGVSSRYSRSPRRAAHRPTVASVGRDTRKPCPIVKFFTPVSVVPGLLAAKGV